MNNQTEENSNLEDNPTIENSVEVAEIDFPRTMKTRINCRKLMTMNMHPDNSKKLKLNLTRPGGFFIVRNRTVNNHL
ncbi:hypothetical protein [Nitrosomonas ureae]|uniref:Uncharacterized protein n=1 Tax=Nitrosomonas ureae TaxID=44577 RepID=A0A286A3N6_9PROT|nr:hypothetical protein [Nitrosomonas ureae]SOD16522.1 hypothetical protein SAMN06297164_0607 [Nitrosomonas ureae]